MENTLRVGQSCDVIASLVNYYGISKGKHLLYEGDYFSTIHLFTDYGMRTNSLHILYLREIRKVGKLTITKVK